MDEDDDSVKSTAKTLDDAMRELQTGVGPRQRFYEEKIKPLLDQAADLANAESIPLFSVAELDRVEVENGEAIASAITIAGKRDGHGNLLPPMHPGMILAIRACAGNPSEELMDLARAMRAQANGGLCPCPACTRERAAADAKPEAGAKPSSSPLARFDNQDIARILTETSLELEGEAVTGQRVKGAKELAFDNELLPAINKMREVARKHSIQGIFAFDIGDGSNPDEGLIGGGIAAEGVPILEARILAASGIVFGKPQNYPASMRRVVLDAAAFLKEERDKRLAAGQGETKFTQPVDAKAHKFGSN